MPQKKDPDEVRQTRVELARKMRERRAAKHAAAVAAGTAGRRSTRERGITTIQVNVEDARILAELAKAKCMTRRAFLHGFLTALAPAKDN